jgi:hypothetical protein
MQEVVRFLLSQWLDSLATVNEKTYGRHSSLMLSWCSLYSRQVIACWLVASRFLPVIMESLPCLYLGSFFFFSSLRQSLTMTN